MYEDQDTVVTEPQAVEDDAQLEGLTEATDDAEDIGEALEEAANEPAQTEHQETTPQASEPGWIKKRVNAAVDKAVAATEARLRAEYEAKMAPVIERMREQEAQDLVRSGEFKSLERAKEYLALKGGYPTGTTTAQQPATQPAQSNDPVIEARAGLLAKQAQKIKASRGLDVMAEWQNNADVRDKINSGEWDFYDVAESMSKPKRKAAAPMRSPNGANGSERSSIASMSDEQFEQLEKNIRERKKRYSI